MATHFITALKGVISGQHCGDINVDFFGTPYHGHDRIVIPVTASVNEFDRVEYYDTEWNRKPTVQLIDEGLLPMPHGYVREGDNLRPMMPEERILSGLDEPPPGFKVVDGEIVPMTLLEQVEAGQITQENYEQRMAADNTAELQRRLGELQTPEALAMAEIDEDYAAERRAQLTALLAVKQQPGWPITVEWPEESVPKNTE